MEKMFRFIFALCIIFGFQIHVPVTMLPASWDLASSQGLLNHGLFDNGKGMREAESVGKIRGDPLIDSEPSFRDFKPTNNHISDGSGYKTARVTEYITPRKYPDEQAKYTTVLDSSQGEHYHLNTDVNQARPLDHRSFNIVGDLTGLEGSLDLKHAKSSQSDFNRLSKDLVGVRLKHIESQLSNLSIELSTRRTLHDQNTTKTNTLKKQYINFVETTTDKPNQIQTNGDENERKTQEKNNENNIVVDGIEWSQDVEDTCPKHFSDKDYTAWKRKVEASDVIKMEEGCGSMQNRLVTFNDSTKACVRYRMNAELMQGEIYSFYLGKLLKMGYSPPTAMTVPVNSYRWRQVKQEIKVAQWAEHQPAVLTQWWPQLEQVHMPFDLRDPDSRLRPENDWLKTRPRHELCGIVQWTDLVLFDYISGNLDRIVNNLYNLQWNSKMLEKPIHNLMKIKSSDLLLFLDNESGLFHGYRLLDSYAGYHEKILKSICVFRKSTIDAIERLHRGGNSGIELQNLYQSTESNHGSLPRMSKKIMNILQDRITSVYKHIQLCKSKSPSSQS